MLDKRIRKDGREDNHAGELQVPIIRKTANKVLNSTHN
jgi:hypothetical protein